MIDDMNDPNMMDDMDDDDDDDDMIENDECQIHLKDDNVMDADLNNEPFINMNNANSNNVMVNHYMNISSTINPNLNTAVNDYYQNVMQMQNGESV